MKRASSLALASLCFAACGGQQSFDGLATVRFDLTQAPSDATCLQVTITGATRAVTKNFTLSGGQSTSSMTASGIPTGAVEITGNAYSVICGQVTGLTTATWVVTPLSVTFTSAGPNSATLVLTRNGQATLGFNFQDDSRTVTTIAGAAGSTGSTDGTGSAARFNAPFGMVADTSGNLYVADNANDTIRKIVLSTLAVTTVAGSAGVTGTTDGVGTAARFNQPYGLAIDNVAGILYISDAGNCTLRKMVLSSLTVSTVAGQPCNSTASDGTGTAARFLVPSGISLDGLGNLYVADQFGVRQVVLSSAVVSTIAGTFGAAGYLDGSALSARFGNAAAVAYDGGSVYITDRTNNAIRKLALGSPGTVSTLAGSTTAAEVDGVGTSASFNGPWGIAADGQGNLLVVDWGGDTVRKVVESSGITVTVAGTGGSAGTSDGTGSAARFTAPFMVGIDSSGVAYVSDDSSDIRRLQ